MPGIRLRPDTHPIRKPQVPSMMSVSTGRSHRKDVVSEYGGEPVWHDFPEEAPRWLREGFPPTRILTGHAHQGGPRGQTSTRPHR